MNKVQFAIRFGGTTREALASHVHAGLRSAPQTKTYKRWNERKTLDLLAAVAETDVRYQEWIDANPPAALSREQRLRIAAAGHPDLDSTHAARRLLVKYGYEEA